MKIMNDKGGVLFFFGGNIAAFFFFMMVAISGYGSNFLQYTDITSPLALFFIAIAEVIMFVTPE